MKKSKFSIPFKALFGYVLLAGFGALTIWFIFKKVQELNLSEQPDDSRQKMALISEAATRLYITDGISRNIIHDKDTTGLEEFRNSIDTISTVLDSLKILYKTEETKAELDSIGQLLTLKEENLLELLEFRAENASDNYYDRVLKRLEQADYLFGSLDYEEMVKDLEPYQQKVITDYLQYGEEIGADRLTNRTADELINTTKQVLLSLELQEHEYQKRISEKENNLLTNDIKISNQLRKIRTKIEQEEIRKSLERIESGQETMDQTYTIMIVFGIATLITILIFGMMIIRDTNKSRLYRKELEQAKGYAEHLLSSREQIMATVTHDLRSPLGSILGYVDLMGKTELSAKQKNYLNQLKKSSDFTMKLINDLLDLSKLEAGKISVDKVPFVPAQLIEDVINTSIPSPDQKSLEIISDLSEETQGNFISDPFRIQQILTNLIGNAYKFTEKGEIQIQAEIHSLGIQESLRIEVKDTGIGISDNQLNKIFEEFSQADESTEKKYGGFGLGLTITQKMVELLGGTIEVKSKLGKGTTFVVEIPVKEANRKDRVKEKQKNLKLKNAKEKHVLIVDDEQAQLNLISEILKNANFKIDIARNGVEALQKLEEIEVDAVLTDIQMPKMDGFRLLKEIRKDKNIQHLPVIALSGMTDKSLEEYLTYGFDNFLVKPYEINALLSVIGEALGLELEVVQPSASDELKVDSDLYDLTDLETFTDGDKEAIQGIIESLIESTTTNLQKILDAQTAENKENIAFVAHKMIPMLKQIRATEAVKPLERLETQISKMGWQEINELIEEAEKQLQKLLEALKAEWE
ncbi:MAG TPA: ATP-binding protein [Flavobacteriaceae bacterium]|nr:ATP-binding protein [Flavobacteriaceae bacterium]